MPVSLYRRAAVAIAIVVLVPAPAHSQAMIRVNDSVNVKFGLLSQTWADYTQNVRQDSSYAQNYFIRHIRFLVGGQVGSHLTFFFDTDNPNLGRSGGTTKSVTTGFVTQDALIEVKPGKTNAFLLDAGFQYVPLTRNSSQTPALLLPIDAGAYTTLSSAAMQAVAGRDVGFLAKGYLAGQHLEYKAGVFQGWKNSLGATQVGSNSPRLAGRLVYNFLDAEDPSYAYTGTYLGKKKVFALGGGIDGQGQFESYAADAFLDYPLTGGSLTLQGAVVRYDGGTSGPFSVVGTAPYIAKQNTFLVEAGYYLTDIKVTPWIKIEGRMFDSGVKGTAAPANQDESRFQVGGTWYVMGHNFNIKAAYQRNTFDRLNLSSLSQNSFTIQFQGFYY